MGERQLIHIGFGNTVSSRRLISIVSPESAPIRRLIQDARENGRLIDATYGRRTRAVIIMDSDHVVLSAFHPVTVAHRWTGESLTSNREKSVDLIKEDEEMDNFDLPTPEDEDMSIDEDVNIEEDMGIDEEMDIDEEMNIDELDELEEDEGEKSR